MFSFFHADVRGGWAIMAMPRMQGGDLAEVIERQRKLHPDEARLAMTRVSPAPGRIESLATSEEILRSQHRRALQGSVVTSDTYLLHPPQVFSGLGYMHEQGLVHGDLKVRVR